ncbi:MAG: acetate uptake transporter [Actinomycetota bacterium]|nr:acetate uptake transporter [Actinomycetota bacterium]
MSIDTSNELRATDALRPDELRTAPQSQAAAQEPAGAAAAVPFADPAPLGLAAFALTTFILSFVNAGLLPVSVEPVVFGLALFYGGLAQFAAGIWEFANRNTFGATAFCSYGAFWMAFWFLVTSTDLSGAGAEASKGIGVFLLAWGIFTLYMTIAARATNRTIFAIFTILTLTFFALAAGAYWEATALTRIGGWLGIATALLAWYGSMALVTNSTHKRTVLPV